MLWTSMSLCIGASRYASSMSASLAGLTASAIPRRLAAYSIGQDGTTIAQLIVEVPCFLMVEVLAHDRFDLRNVRKRQTRSLAVVEVDHLHRLAPPSRHRQQRPHIDARPLPRRQNIADRHARLRALLQCRSQPDLERMEALDPVGEQILEHGLGCLGPGWPNEKAAHKDPGFGERFVRDRRQGAVAARIIE